MGKIGRRFLRLNYDNPGAIRATDIPYDSVSSIKDLIDAEHNNSLSGGETTTTSANWQNKTSLTFNNLPVGKYRIGWYYEFKSTSTSVKFMGRVRLDDTDVKGRDEYFPSNVGNYLSSSGFFFLTVAGASENHHADIDFRSGTSGTTVGIRRARLEIQRV